ncbi:MAG: AMP-binding protein, partial [Paracoccaceae bacterium]|nr:AMP-binding protein [Paracoccaceae bacterium]
MTESKIYPPAPEFVAQAHADKAKYDAMYAASVADPDTFWGKEALRLDWIKPFTKVKNTTFAHPDVSIKWFEDGVLNVSANCVDRHLPERAEQTALIWESDDPNIARHISYAELSEHVNKLSNVYKQLGVKKGDRVVLYMPMIPEATYAMLACARIGAVHSIVFAGFSPEALASRIGDCGASLVVTADEAPRGGKNTPLKTNVDKALAICGDVQTLVVERTGGNVDMKEGRDHAYGPLMAMASEN